MISFETISDFFFPSPQSVQDGMPHGGVFSAYPNGNHKSARLAFFRKVMGILLAMVTVTACITSFVVFYVSLSTKAWLFRQWFAYGWWLLIPVEWMAITLLRKHQRDYPYNYILLIFLNLSTSATVAVVCSIHVTYGQATLIVESLQITAFLFGGLTAFGFQSKYDFTPWNTTCTTILLGLFWWNLAEIVFGYHTSSDLAIAGSVVFCGLVVVDVQRVLTRIGPEDAVLAAIHLYLDLINLFLYILKLSKGTGNNNNTDRNQRRRPGKQHTVRPHTCPA